ncbi:MAG: substrate-binding domain-containing protein [Thermoguttaceae bacterium]
MTRVDEVVRQIRAELASGRHGRPSDRFMAVRQVSARYGVSLVTAQRVVHRLKQDGLLIGDSTNRSLISRTAVEQSEQVAPQETEEASPRRLGMIVTNIVNPFFSRLCRHVQHSAAMLGYQVLMAGSQYDCEREEKAVNSFLQIGIDGLIIVPGFDEACKRLYRRLIEKGVRLVLIGRRMDGMATDFVTANNFGGGAAMASHLLGLGYHSFGYIRFGDRLKRDDRLSGFRAALLEEDVALDAKDIVSAEGGTIEHGRLAMAELMRGRSRPRAVFAYHDLLAIGALQYCQENGISVPDEVAIAGFDNLPEGRVTTPSLTTVGYPIESMARLAVQCVIEHRTQGPPWRSDHRILLEPNLVVRRSTDPTASAQDSSTVLTGDLHHELF